jgi:hypothetical protein
MKRRVPRPSELAPLLQFRKPQFSPTKRRLQSALTIDDLREIARRRTPKAAFDYTDGAAEEELSLTRAGRRSATSSFIRRSCGTSRRSTPAGPCSAITSGCRSG